MEELKGKFAEAEMAVEKLREKVAGIDLSEKRLQCEWDENDSEPEIKLSLEMKAEEIIPKECWELVFQNLDAEDLLSCRQVCKTFNQLLDLQEFKVKWNFHLVLPLLLPYLKKSRSLYNARLVCRSWRHSIGDYASEVQSFVPRPGYMPLLTRFKTSEDIVKFQERFGECNTNPFPSRSVFIYARDARLVEHGEPGDMEDRHNAQKRLQDAYIEKIGELLEQFGKHIFRLKFWFEYQRIFGPDTLTLYKLIKRITLHLPNLKELQVSRNEPDVKEEEVASYVAENALVALPKLQALNMGLEKKLEEYLLDAFGLQLTQLEMHYSDNLPSQYQMQRIKNVRKLSLALNEPSDTLEALRFLQSPLNLLNLACQFGPEGTLNVDKVLRNLKHLPILEMHLWLWDRENLAEAGLDIDEYNNASIETLIIQIDLRYFAEVDHQISFNFLQALTKLENLEFRLLRGGQPLTAHPGELPEVVKLNEYLWEETNSIYHSNVWEKVPSLKTLTLTREEVMDEFVKTIYTREKYESFMIIPEWFFKA